jgi:hypothetical protein
VSVNTGGLEKNIATLRDSGHLTADAPADPAVYIDDQFLQQARAVS